MAHGRVLAGRYRLVEALGRGGFGEVWRGHDVLLGRAVAVKLLAGAIGQPERVRRLHREAQALARLAHPNVVAVFDAGVDDSDAFVVMELLAGPSLAGLLASRGALPVGLAVRYAGQAAAGLAAAHAVGVVHRDVKPGNLVLSAGGEVKVVDFGIAAMDNFTLTSTVSIVGTPAYLSPEQAAGTPADQRSDVYSLGCVLFALLTGEPPFTGEHPVAVAHQHVTAPAPAARLRRPEIPARVDMLMTSMLAKDPADRPRDAGIVRDQLAAAEQAPDAAGYSPGMHGAPGTHGASGDWPHTLRLSQLTQPPAETRRRSRWPMPAIGSLVLTVAAALILLNAFAPSGGSPPTQPSASSPAQASNTASPLVSAPPVTVAGALTTAEAALVRAANAGDIQMPAAQDLGNHLNDIAKAIAQGDLSGARHQADDLLRRLDHLANDGQITPTGLAIIGPPLQRLDQLLPAKDGHGQGQQD